MSKAAGTWRGRRAVAVVVTSLVVLGGAGLGLAKPSQNGATKPDKACAKPPTKMVAWWPFDEAAGVTAKEIVQSINGSWQNGPASVPARSRAGSVFTAGTASPATGSTSPITPTSTSA